MSDHATICDDAMSVGLKGGIDKLLAGGVPADTILRHVEAVVRRSSDSDQEANLVMLSVEAYLSRRTRREPP